MRHPSDRPRKCVACGGCLQGTCRTKYCEACAPNNYGTKKERIDHETRLCRHCGRLFRVLGDRGGHRQKYCNTTCGNRHREILRGVGHQLIECKSCKKPFFKGKTRRILCSACSPVNQRPELRGCSHCGESFLSDRKDAKYCSPECVHLSQRTYKGTIRECAICGAEYEPCTRDQKCCSKKCQMAATHRAMKDATKVTKQCVTCGDDYMADPRAANSKYCDPCRMKLYSHNGARNRARKWGVEYEPIDKMKVFARDHWKCGICGERVDQRKRYPHSDSASLDHIVPISVGGGHVWSNVQCSHLGCNSSKYNTVANSQLRLELTA